MIALLISFFFVFILSTKKGRSYINFFNSFVHNTVSAYFEKDVQIKHIGNLGYITFPHHGKTYQIFFPFKRSLENKMSNSLVYLAKSDGETKELSLYPGFDMKFSAKDFSYDFFQIKNLDDGSVTENETLTYT